MAPVEILFDDPGAAEPGSPGDSGASVAPLPPIPPPVFRIVVAFFEVVVREAGFSRMPVLPG